MNTETIPSPASQETIPPKLHGGIRRLAFLIGYIVLISAARGVGQLNSIWAIYTYGATALLLMSVLVAARLKNIGASMWLALLLIVPLANLYILFRCFVEPEGYQNTKELDRAGNIVASIVGYTLFILMIGIVIFVAIQVIK